MSKSNTFGKFLKQQRMLKKLTQAKLAELAGVHEKHISKLETGTFNPNYETLNKILEALGIGTESTDFITDNTPDNTNPFYIKILQLINNSTDSELKFFYGLLKQAKKGLDAFNKNDIR